MISTSPQPCWPAFGHLGSFVSDTGPRLQLVQLPCLGHGAVLPRMAHQTEKEIGD